MAPILETHGLAKMYGRDATAVTALHPTDLRVETGEFLAVMGPSGSGKSTLLHLLGGLDTPTAGRVEIEGTDLFALPERKLAVFRRRKIGFIFQFFNLMPVLTAEENVLLPVLIDGGKVDHPYLDGLFDLLGLSARRRHLPGALSGGEQQRVAIARALVNKPAVIFADEPTGNLDSGTTGEVLDLLKTTSRQFGQTLVMITHDPKVAGFADRVITMVDGRIELGVLASL
jgi:putative ABC transport system ATP-binding protein